MIDRRFPNFVYCFSRRRIAFSKGSNLSNLAIFTIRFCRQNTYPRISNPVSVPVLDPNLSASIPMRCSMLTKRLHNGGGAF